MTEAGHEALSSQPKADSGGQREYAHRCDGNLRAFGFVRQHHPPSPYGSSTCRRPFVQRPSEVRNRFGRARGAQHKPEKRSFRVVAHEGVIDALIPLVNLTMHVALVVIPDLPAGLREDRSSDAEKAAKASRQMQTEDEA